MHGMIEGEPLPPAGIEWRSGGQPHSRRFGDVYFSAGDGLAEARHVFLDGTGLPGAWSRRHRFTIGETGFGTGLNFLAAWDLWRRDPDRCRRLHFVSVEGYPLDRRDLVRALAAWPGLAPLATCLAEAWPARQPGFHRLDFEGGAVTLTLLFGPVEEMLRALEAEVDAWFLDGFAPGRNPDMWTQAVFDQAARLSRPGTALASFTAAGHVRRGLGAAGFTVGKHPGFGTKREMLRARFDGAPHPGMVEPWYRPPPARPPGRALVIGGGIAGASAADALARRGWSVTLAERHGMLAAEGSGNRAGIVMPRLVIGAGPERRFHAQAFLHALARLDPWLRACGVLDLPTAPEREARRADEVAAARILPHDDLHAVDAAEAGAHARVAVAPGGRHGSRHGSGHGSGHDASWRGLWLPRAGWLDPAAACRGLAAAAEPRFGTDVLDGEAGMRDADLLVLAGGPDTRRFPAAAWLPLSLRRGQVTLVPATDASARLASVLNGDGYVIPASDGCHVVGATFDAVADAVPAPPQAATARDDARNLERVSRWLPGLLPGGSAFRGYAVEGRAARGRAALRAMTPDHLPLAGPLPDRAAWLAAYTGLRTGNARIAYPDGVCVPDTWVLTGFGARGLTTAPLAAELMAAQIAGEPWPVPRDVAAALHPGRFLIRALARRRL
ncbi:MAG TPA: bifunctional tRNA (5-methylaminomethyl-2-thiouridine)(34)-methyltransferase MnmD/FAD-dependent 5-carboxymethylaminomethyl-2-thiouridine(34) oxidoreductase MnmC [Arenibaculum sp.]|nr:bifunctional tRNA (5-methylaminomethyl-2-thiouridine)(34)-methyltransferase MnmD/FAD-dependent 5-carboxymethylaminomethyl-2-thiouridine(34) oxidoreductase MnmC [Arenibaculum sp.]